MRNRLVTAGAILAFVLTSGGIELARAGGLAAARFGAELGNPTSSHPTALYFNPAGLALGEGTRIYGEGAFIYRTSSYQRPEGAIDTILEPGDMGSGTPREAVGANSGEATLSNFLTSPFAAVVSDLGVDGLGVGLGLYAPFGGQATWDEAPEWDGDEAYPGAVDGPQRWFTIDGSIRALYITGAGSYRINDQISVGVGLNVVRQSISTIRARTVSGTDDLVSTTSGNVIEGRSLVEADTTQLSVGGGVMWRPIDALGIGASYQSQPGFGETSMSGTLESKFGSGPASSTDIQLVQSLPDVTRLGVSWRARPNVEVRVSGDYSRWSVMEYQCFLDAGDPDAKCAFNDDGSVDRDAGGGGIIASIPRNWNDTFGVRAGASYWFRPGLEVSGGLAYDGNAVPDDRLEASIIDMDKLLGTLGVRWERGTVAILASFTQVVYFERTIEPRPRDDMGEPIALESPSRVPDGAGTYNQSISLFNLGVEAQF